MKTVSMPIDLARESVKLGADAAALAEKVASDYAAIENKAPLVAEAMVENGVVDELHKQATIDLLKNPVATLDIVARLSKLASQPRSMGTAATEKPAADDFDPRFPPKKESDRVFEAAFTPGV